MAAALLDEKCSFRTTSPSTLSPNSLSTQFPSDTKHLIDLETGTSIPAPEKRTWRARLGIRQPEQFDDVGKTETRQLEQCYTGYPLTAAFMSSEQSFSLYRGFGYLHSRVLLDLQDRIAALERELDTKDKMDVENGESFRLESRERDVRQLCDDGNRPRERILSDIRERLVEYDEILVKSKEVASFQRPSTRDYRSVRYWFKNKAPLVEREQKFIKQKEDLVSVSSAREWGMFDGFVESLLLKVDCKLVQWLFLTQELRDKTQDKNIRYYARSRVDKLIGLFITSIIFILLILPVIAMYKLTAIGLSQSSQSTFSAIGVLVVFTLLFSAAMSLLTKALRHELFAASAAYCAVLVVFISNFSNT